MTVTVCPTLQCWPVPGMVAVDPQLALLLRHVPHTAVLAYTVAALSPNMDVANAALPAYVVVSFRFKLPC